MKPIKNLGQTNSIFNNFIAELRSENAQRDSMRFRKNLERIGEIFAYEISKDMEYENREVITPLGIANTKLLKEKPVLATILRAGLPMHQGMLNYFDDSENAFISAFRKYYRDGSFEIQVDYMSAPNIEGRTLIIADSMLATGESMMLSYKELLNNGKPKHTHIVCGIASAQGIEYLQKNLSPRNCTIWVGAVDDELTANAFIVPGLGDAGDLAYGNKLND
jgi:uracil phosphoribosyltransferase